MTVLAPKGSHLFTLPPLGTHTIDRFATDAHLQRMHVTTDHPGIRVTTSRMLEGDVSTEEFVLDVDHPAITGQRVGPSHGAFAITFRNPRPGPTTCIVHFLGFFLPSS